jgi:hypothetical protein
MAFEKRDYKKIKIRPVKMTCDEPFAEEPLATQHFFWQITGRPRSGKTAYLISLLCYPKSKDHNGGYFQVFDRVWWFSPSVNTLGEDIPLDPSRFKNDISELGELIANLDKTERTLFVFDDMMSQITGRYVRLFQQLVWNRRHLNCSIFVLGQVYNTLKLSLRKCVSHLTIFKTTSKRELDSLYEDYFSFLDREKFDALCAYIWDEKFNSMYLVTDTSQVYKNFDEVILPA